MNMGQQVRSVSKSDLREGEKKKSIQEASQLPAFAPVLHKCSPAVPTHKLTVSLQRYVITREREKNRSLAEERWFFIFMIINERGFMAVGEILYEV